nr:unnamed protein product [Spirometra erinaceieuropaei]
MLCKSTTTINYFIHKPPFLLHIVVKHTVDIVGNSRSLTINPDRPLDPLWTFSTASTTAAEAAAAAAAARIPTTTTHNPDAPSNRKLTTASTSGVDSAQACPHCDHTFTPPKGLVGHLQIHFTETGESVP